MGWQKTHQPDFDSFKEAKGYMSLFCEIIASCLFILIGSNGGKDIHSGFSWGIAFVVVRIVFSGAHVNSWITFYKIFTGQENLITGLFTFGAQFLGAFIAQCITAETKFNLTEDKLVPFKIAEWQSGLKEMIALSLFLWCWLHSEAGNTGAMPKSIFMILAVAVTFFFCNDTTFTMSRCFGTSTNILAMGPYVLWGFVAVVTTHVKRRILGLETRWFFQE